MRNEFYTEFDWARREPVPKKEGDFRTPFQIDRDRIIHTSAFRRLQSKTQVFMSGEYDFYRTRLTHSIEVAQIGRSICSRLQSVSDELGPDCFIDPDLVEAACLAHDIGHPPFGHTGERTLHRLMKPHGGFEGNAQTLRMLTRTIFSEKAGMNPTRALMDGVLKYKTLYPELDDPPNHFLYSGQSEDRDFVMAGHSFPKELAAGKVRDGFRSIECQIMDWADDTAYSLNDVADGINAGFITIEKMERWAEQRNLKGAVAGHVDGLCEAIRGQRVEAKMNKRIGYFIAAAELRQDANFLSDQTRRYRYRLEIDPAIAEECGIYKKLSYELVFSSQKLQQLDKKSDFIVTRLFGALADLYIERDRPGPNHFRLLSQKLEQQIFEADTATKRARLVCDAIARMTDIVAVRTYKRLFDADFGSIMDLV
jgi:dGTPase